MALFPLSPGSPRGRRNAITAGAAVLLAGGLAGLAWEMTSGAAELPGAASLSDPVDTPHAPVAAKPTVLAEIGDLPTTARASKRAQASRGTNLPGAAAPTAKAAETMPRDPEAPREEPAARRTRPSQPKVPTFPVLVTPEIDVSRIAQLNLGALVSLRGSIGGAGPGSRGGAASTRGFIANLPSLKLPGVASSDHMVVTVMVDHPDAMPGFAHVLPTDWGFDGAHFVSSPRVVLQPLEAKLRLGLRPHKSVRVGRSGRTSVLEGTVRLIQIEPDGNVLTLDAAEIGGGRAHRYEQLRYRSTSDEVLLLGIPDKENAAADVIAPAGVLTEVSPRDRWDGSPETKVEMIRLRTTARARTLPPLHFVALDPFNEPVKGATVTATVDIRAVARFHQRGGPIQVDGFVFVNCSANDFAMNGQVVTDDAVGPMSLGLVRALASATSNGSGSATLVGIPLGVHKFIVTSPFGQAAPVLSPVTSLESGNVARPPVVGLEVQCPLAWRADPKGKDAWARAKVKVTGRDQMKPFSKADGRALAPRRFLIPENQACTVTCSAKGLPDQVAQVRPQPGRVVLAVTPSKR